MWEFGEHSSFSTLNFQMYNVASHPRVSGPEFVVEVEFVGEGWVAEFDGVGEITQLQLVAVGASCFKGID